MAPLEDSSFGPLNSNDPVPEVDFVPINQPQGKPEISFQVIPQAWGIIRPYLGIYMGAAILLCGPVWMSLFFWGSKDMPTPTGDVGSTGPYPLIIEWLVFLLGAGVMRMSINHLRTGKPQFGEIFTIRDVALHLTFAAILLNLAFFVGLGCLCIVPGFLATGLYMFTIPLIVDHHMRAWEAMKTSYRVLKPQMWAASLFAVVLWLVSGLGIWACCLGILVTIPLAIMSLAITYRNFFDGDADLLTIPPASVFPPAPIADPHH